MNVGTPIGPTASTPSSSTRSSASKKWDRWLEQGRYAEIKELAAAEGITSPSYASRILRLVLLAPDIQESILFGEQPAELALSQLMDGVGLAW